MRRWRVAVAAFSAILATATAAHALEVRSGHIIADKLQLLQVSNLRRANAENRSIDDSRTGRALGRGS